MKARTCREICNAERLQSTWPLSRESFGARVYRTRIGKTIRFAEAPVEGKSVIRYDSGGQAARWYRQLAREVVAGPMGMAPGGAGKAAA